MPASTHRFITVDHAVLDDSRLDPLAFRLYCHYARVAGRDSVCWQADRTIAAATGMSARSVRYARTLLEHLRYIAIDRRAGATLEVTLRPVDAAALQKSLPLGPIGAAPRAEVASRGLAPDADLPRQEVPDLRQEVPTKKIPLKKNPMKKICTDDQDPALDRASEALRGAMTAQNFSTYLDGVRLGTREGALTLATADAFKAAWLETRLSAILARVAHQSGFTGVLVLLDDAARAAS